jgi:uncharacterized protein DUF6126
MKHVERQSAHDEVGTTPSGTAGPAPEPKRAREWTLPRGLVIRLLAYLVAGHLFAGFLYLLFQVGARSN